MAAKTLFVICAQIVLLEYVQSVTHTFLTPESLSTACRGPLVLSSSSPISPSGLNICANDLSIDGNLNVNGSLPFLAAVAMEGPLPIDGSSKVAYGCGNGEVGIVQEGIGCGVRSQHNTGHY